MYDFSSLTNIDIDVLGMGYSYCALKIICEIGKFVFVIS